MHALHLLSRVPLLRLLCFLIALSLSYRILVDRAMGFRDVLKGKLQGDSQKTFNAPPPVPHHTRPGAAPPAHAGKPFVTVQNGKLVLEDGTPFRFASLNAPELLDGHEFEVEDTMRTLAGFGRRVTRTYTLKIKGTSPHFGDAGHINGWDSIKGDWIYDEGKWQKVRRSRSVQRRKTDRSIHHQIDKVIALAEKCASTCEVSRRLCSYGLIRRCSLGHPHIKPGFRQRQ